MRRTVVSVSFALALVVSVAGVASAEAPLCTSADSVSTDSAALAGSHSTGDFCDQTADHGSSKSCKEEAAAQGLLVCPAGTHVANLNCSLTGNKCNNGNGSWCKCSYDCHRDADAEPIEPVDGEPIEP